MPILIIYTSTTPSMESTVFTDMCNIEVLTDQEIDTYITSHNLQPLFEGDHDPCHYLK